MQCRIANCRFTCSKRTYLCSCHAAGHGSKQQSNHPKVARRLMSPGSSYHADSVARPSRCCELATFTTKLRWQLTPQLLPRGFEPRGVSEGTTKTISQEAMPPDNADSRMNCIIPHRGTHAAYRKHNVSGCAVRTMRLDHNNHHVRYERKDRSPGGRGHRDGWFRKLVRQSYHEAASSEHRADIG